MQTLGITHLNVGIFRVRNNWLDMKVQMVNHLLSYTKKIRDNATVEIAHFF